MNREQLLNVVNEQLEACKNGNVIVEGGTVDELIDSLNNLKRLLEEKKRVKNE